MNIELNTIMVPIELQIINDLDRQKQVHKRCITSIKDVRNSYINKRLLPQEQLLLMEGQPLLEPVNQSAFVNGDADVYPQSIGSLRRSLVFLDHGLNAALRVTPYAF